MVTAQGQSKKQRKVLDSTEKLANEEEKEHGRKSSYSQVDIN